MIKMKKEIVAKMILFGILGLIALQIPFTNILGANVKFTLFDFLAPTFGAFLGLVPAIVILLITQIANILIHGTAAINTGVIIRLFPTLFAVSYFAKKRSFNIIIPAVCMIVFNLHPIGRSAWQYSLFWLIPIVAHFYRKNLFVKSLGSTFTAHAVGGALWVWTFGLSREIWLALIPQVAIERFLMASGISISFVILKRGIAALSKNKFFSRSFRIAS